MIKITTFSFVYLIIIEGKHVLIGHFYATYHGGHASNPITGKNILALLLRKQ